MSRVGMLCLSVLSCVLLFDIPAKADRQTDFFTIDYPGAIATTVNGINARRDAVGSYVDAAGHVHGFLLSRGKFSAIDVPGALMTEARGINARGDIVGSYNLDFSIPGFGFRGFLIRRGVLTRVDYPGHLNTIIQRITETGVMLGCYHDFGTDQPPLLTMYGIVIKGSKYSSFNLATSMNKGATEDAQKIVGEYWDFDMNTERGYLLEDGRFKPFDMPGNMFTMPWDMNNSGEIAGMFMDSEGNSHGFAGKLGHFNAIDFPGAKGTTVYGINPQGEVAGSYVDSSGKTHGFFARRASSEESD